jgi:hypothetical protein
LQPRHRLFPRLVDLGDTIDIGRPWPMATLHGTNRHQYPGWQCKRDLGVSRCSVAGDLIIIRGPRRSAPAKCQSSAE